MDEFDVVCLGGGVCGEAVAGELKGTGLTLAVVERELVGGECAYWACIPSKTLLRPPEVRGEAERVAGLERPGERWKEIAAYRDFMIRNLDDSKQVRDYRDEGVDVYKGEGRIGGPGRIEVGDHVLSAKHIIVATGSDPAIPPIEGLDEAGF